MKNGTLLPAKLMKKSIILTLAILMLSIGIKAQETKKSINKVRQTSLWGHVFDSFTHREIDGALITLMKDDSTFVDTVRTSADEHDAWYKFMIPASPQKYIIKAEKEGYDPCFVDFNVKFVARITYFDAPWHYMKKHITYYKSLDEVVVKASKVQLVWKGDTMVFNADAFNIPDGSMLDDLIRQMPGVKLKDNGEITVNGRKIDYLTLNGSDFFKGNNKMMLENLPYFTVKNVRVFDKTTDKSKFLGYDAEKKEYVMDVQLKREYSVGMIGNVEVAGGTSDRWLARAFGLRYSDHSRFTIFGNMNNTNETRHPGGDGDWDPSNSPTGETTYKTVQANLRLEDSDKRWNNEAYAGISSEKIENEYKVASTSYLQSGSSFQRSTNNNLNDNFQAALHNQFTMDKPTRPFYLYQNTNFTYNHSKTNVLGRNALFNTDPASYGDTNMILDSIFSGVNGSSTTTQSLQQSLVHKLLNESKSRGNNWELKQDNLMIYKLPWGDELEFKLNGSYSKGNVDSYEHYYLDYAQNTGQNDYRNKFNPIKTKAYEWLASAQYTLNFLNGWQTGFYFEHDQHYNSFDNPFYRLERKLSWQNIRPEIGTLPPDGLTPDLLDIDNSIEGYSFFNSNALHPWANYHREDTTGYERLLIKFPMTLENNRERYIRNTTDALVHQNKFHFDPSIMYIRWWKKRRLQYDFYANRSTSLPDMENLVGYRDESNPLNISIGNPNLKPSHRYSANTYISKSWPKIEGSLFASIYGNIIENGVTNSFTYNAIKGVYTNKPVNINGTWYVNSGLEFSRAIDKKKLWLIGNNLGLSYSNVPAMGTDQSASLNEATKYFIRSTRLNEYFYIRLHTGEKFDVTPSMGIEYLHATGTLSTYKTANTYDLYYGFNLHWTMPLGIQLATDLKMYNRRGYEASEMNTNNLIWNAQLSRTFFKNLTAKVEAFDMLGQMTQTIWSTSTTGFTNTWRRSLPRYVMLHLIWKFNRIPQKAKGNK